jgi:hypothetical protein
MTVRGLATLALAAQACASVGEPASPPGPPPFEGVRRVALVRWVEDPSAARAKDALDALRESLDARGYETRVVEVGPRNGDRRDLESLFMRIDGRIAAGAARGRSGRGVDRVGDETAAVFAALDVDALAMVHRFERHPLATPFDSPFTPRPPGSVFDAPPPGESYRPVGALSLVSRAGHVVWLDWGTPASADPRAPANAAEAVDGILSVLAGRDADADEP